MNESYSRAQKILHWLLAVLVLFWLFVSGAVVESSEGEAKGFILMFHSGGAIVILALMVYRYSLRRKHPVASLPDLKSWEKTWSRTNHVAFYILVGVMVGSGILQGIFFEQDVRVFGLINITSGHNESVLAVFHIIHEITATLLKLLIAVHILAALKHQFIDKKPFLKRMA
tara:strand:- start:13179 stop:13691 length:513 start_codon:yes stop_codon:yes gene_type:complete